MQAKFILSLWTCHTVWICQVLSAFHSEPCGSVQPIYGRILKGHAFQSMKTANSLECWKACDSAITCQSFNYVVAKETCELNNRTREAAPEDLVSVKDGLYMKRINRRGEHDTFYAK